MKKTIKKSFARPSARQNQSITQVPANFWVSRRLSF